MKTKLLCAALSCLLFPGLSCAAGAGAVARPDPGRAQRIDALFADYAKPGSPGCAMAVYSQDGIAYAKGYGSANLEDAIAIDPHRTVFNLGSASKQFTAASVQLLVQDGRLRLDDEIHRYLPELPDYGHPITVEQLLHHTSGLRDYVMLLGLGSVLPEDYVGSEDILALIVRQKALDFVPGSEHSYSNTGYFLLARIVERASGMSFREFTRQRLFEPLGMRSTAVRDDHKAIIPARAISYETREEGGYAQFPANHEATGDGSLWTTLDDLARWNRNFHMPTVGGPSWQDVMQRPGTLANGAPLGYASGLFLQTFHGEPAISHPGSQDGYRAELLRLPQRRLSVAVLCNLAESDPAGLAREVADVWLGTPADTTPAAAGAPAGTPAPIASAALPIDTTRYVGVYWNPAAGTIRRIVAENGRLYYTRSSGSRSELVATASDMLQMVGVSNPTSLRFGDGPDGRGFRIDSGDGHPTDYRRVQSFSPDGEALSAFVGRYRSDELQTEWTFRIENGTLMFQQPRYPVQPLSPAFADAFQFQFLLLRFARSTDGRITGFSLDTGRARNVRFERVRD